MGDSEITQAHVDAAKDLMARLEAAADVEGDLWLSGGDVVLIRALLKSMTLRLMLMEGELSKVAPAP
jgi:hypothetical protein